MSGKYPAPELWSDFDGTAVEILPLFHPRNWIKFPLGMLHGYSDFLRAIQNSGITIGGIVSKRPSIIRYWPTLFTIKSLKLDTYFRGKQIVLCGTNRGKGRFIVLRAQERPIAMLEDKPHKLLPPLLLAIERYTKASLPLKPIIVGVVNHPRNHEYLTMALKRIDRPSRRIKAVRGQWQVFVSEYPRPVLTIVLLDPYTSKSGQHFAGLIKSA